MKFCVLAIVICCNYGISVTTNRTSISRRNGVEFNSNRNEITLPIMIHFDKATFKHADIQKYRRKKMVPAVFKTLFKEVEQLYRRPSLNLTIHMKMIDLRLFKKDPRLEDEHVSSYLRSYCRWQGEMKSRQQRHWYSILFTGLDLFYMDGFGREVRTSTGRGYMKGVCSVNNSCALLEWHPKHMAYVLAHEIAHSLGVYHDGPPHNECDAQRYIMNALYDHHNPPKTWSPCTRRDLGHFLKTHYGWCLRPEGKHHLLLH